MREEKREERERKIGSKAESEESKKGGRGRKKERVRKT